MIKSKDVVEGLAHQRAKQICTHPKDFIRDLPSGSICRKCQQPVLPVMRNKPSAMDWMGRIPTRMGVFPSSGEE